MAQTIKLESICHQIGVSQRQARRVLRRAKLPFHKANARWVFNERQTARVLRLLTPLIMREIMSRSH
jgi:hypothetical protein